MFLRCDSAVMVGNLNSIHEQHPRILTEYPTKVLFEKIVLGGS